MIRSRLGRRSTPGMVTPGGPVDLDGNLRRSSRFDHSFQRQSGSFEILIWEKFTDQ